MYLNLMVHECLYFRGSQPWTCHWTQERLVTNKRPTARLWFCHQWILWEISLQRSEQLPSVPAIFWRQKGRHIVVVSQSYFFIHKLKRIISVPCINQTITCIYYNLCIEMAISNYKRIFRLIWLKNRYTINMWQYNTMYSYYM